MPVQIHITGENAQEAIQEFSVLSAAFVGAIAPVAQAPVKEEKPKRQQIAAAKKQEEAKPKPPEASEPDPVGESEPQEEDFGESENIPTAVDLRAKAQEVSKANPDNRGKIKELLNKFGCKNITEVPESKRADFMAELEELG